MYKHVSNISEHSIYMYKERYYRNFGLCRSAKKHDHVRRKANPRLARHIQITVSKRGTFHLILVWRYRVRARMCIKFLEQGLIVLQVASTRMETQDAHKHILII